MIIDLIEDDVWKFSIENIEENRYRFIIKHNSSIEITTTSLEFEKSMLGLSQKILTEIVKEIESNKLTSKYESFELIEDVSGQFLVSVKLKKYHDFELTFINYSADFSLVINGHAYELRNLKEAIALINKSIL